MAGVGHCRIIPQAALSVRASFALCSPTLFHQSTLTGKLATFPWLGLDNATRFLLPGCP